MAIATWYDLLQAHVTFLSGVSGIPAPQVRKLAGSLPDDLLPACIVAKLDAEQLVESNFAQQDLYRYPIGVFLVQSRNRSFDVLPTQLINREALRQKLDVRPPLGNAVTGIHDVTLTPLDPYGDDENSVFDVTGFRCDYDVWEARTST